MNGEFLFAVGMMVFKITVNRTMVPLVNSGFIVAQSLEEAEGDARREIYRLWPKDEGYTGHKFAVTVFDPHTAKIPSSISSYLWETEFRYELLEACDRCELCNP